MARSDFDRPQVTAIVRDTITRVLPSLPESAIRGDRHLRDLGADSVDRVEIILTLLDRLQVNEPMSSFSQLPDVDALVAFLCERCR
jgi:polyketide biosynthesis acyl carrier protein